ncbi:MAG TPA: uracil-DNA glycosylase family protein, partial [Sphingomonadales bacterium]|nr:uracil-DNA glycosylase family protein [Sphingomonadales bacterium]
KGLPLGPRPVLQASSRARILVAGQAPGLKVHNTGLPFNDPSGERLRTWMGMTRETFYDRAKVLVVPMGFCYPGKGNGGDLPPRRECRETWHERLFKALPKPKIRLIIGQYAHAYHLRDAAKKTLTETVRAWREFAPEIFPLPHPSPRNIRWFRKNPWFERELIPELQRRISRILEK